jgi:alkaline phosphatase D
MAAPVATRAHTVSAAGSRAGSHWLGRDWWGNRLQDWQLRDGRLFCVAALGNRLGRTVSALTWDVTRPAVVLRVRTGTITAGKGFSGFVVGTGRQGDDWRSRVLVGAASGEGGGILATYEADGAVRFREHTDEVHQHLFAEMPSEKRRYGGPRRTDEDVTLQLTVRRGNGGPVDLLLRALDTSRGTVLASARMQLSDHRAVRGGIGLMSSDRSSSGARYWFSDFRAEGAGALRLPERGLGPVVGTLFSVSECGLKMTAQLMPLDPDTPVSGSLQLVAPTGDWETVASSTLGPGYTLTFRVPDWDATTARAYRVVLRGLQGSAYTGAVPAEPRGRELTVAHLSCVKAAHRPLDKPSGNRLRLAEESRLGLYTSDNVWFPHDRLAGAMAAHRPDLLVAHGDQVYQNSPTEVDHSHLLLDFLYKYVLWLWSFRELTRCTPSVVLTDDHDVYQANLWGAGGIAARDGDPRSGGYLRTPEWVNVMQQMVSGHNPDPVDPTPVEQQIGVNYGSFVYGGAGFAFLEDRKFKSAPTTQTTDESTLQLLGERQEAFLAAWSGERVEMPKVVLTQTSFACLETDETGSACRDEDSNGWPVPGRDRALRLIRSAGALLVCGDQHIGVLARHGIDRSTQPTEPHFDGPLQFTVPAGCASFQRWFEPGELPGRGAEMHTGDWVDGFDNPVRVLAVVQPSITRAHFRTVHRGGSDLGDRRLKREGYGIVRIDPVQRHFVLECWPWNIDPRAPGAVPYAGFPVAAPFDDNLSHLHSADMTQHAL